MSPIMSDEARPEQSRTLSPQRTPLTSTLLLSLCLMALAGCVEPEENLSPAAQEVVRTGQFRLDQTFTVTNTNNSGSGSLRDAIARANGQPGLDLIVFDIPGNGPHNIAITSELRIESPVTIDGATQPGFVDTPVVNIFHPSSEGIRVRTNGDGTTIQDLAMRDSHRLSIRLENPDDVVIQRMDLSASSCRGQGIFCSGHCTDVTIRDNKIRNRGIALNFEGSGQNVSVTGNDFRSSGCHAYALRLRSVEAPKVSGNDFTGFHREAIRVENINGLRVSPTAATDSPNRHIQLEDNSGVGESTGLSLRLTTASNVIVEGVDFSREGSCHGQGVFCNGTCNNITIRNNDLRNRGVAVNFESSGNNAVITGNDFRSSGCHAYAVRLRSMQNPKMSNNNFTGFHREAIRVENIDGLRVSPTAATDSPNRHIQLEDNSGVGESTGLSLRLSTASNVTVEGVDFSREGSCHGQGVFCNGACNNITIRNNDLRNRGVAVNFESSGNNAVITGNDFRSSGCHAYAVRLRSMQNPKMSNNNFTGFHREAIRVENIDGLRVSPTAANDAPGSHIQLEANSGVGESTGLSLRLTTASNVIVEDVDFSRTDSCHGQGVFCNGTCNNITIRNNDLRNRGVAVNFESSGNNAVITGNDFRSSGCHAYAVRLRSMQNPKMSNNNFTGFHREAIRVENIDGLRVSPTAANDAPDSHIQLEDNSGVGESTGLSLRLSTASNVTVERVDFSREGSCHGQGVFCNGTCNNITIRNNDLRNRGVAVNFESSGNNAVITGNDFRSSGCHAYAVRLRSMQNPKMSNNNFTGFQREAIRVENIDGLRVSPTAATDAPDSHIQLENHSGVGESTGLSLRLTTASNVIAENLNLSREGSCHGQGIYCNGTCNNITIRHNNIRNRGVAVNFESSGSDAVVTGNDFSNSGCHAYAVRLRSITNPRMSGNNFANTSRDAIRVEHMSNLLVTNAVPNNNNSYIVLEEESQIASNTGTPLHLSTVTDSVIEKVNLSYVGNGRRGAGFHANNTTNLRVSEVMVRNRSIGMQYTNGRDASISCSTAFDNNIGVYLNRPNPVSIRDSRIEGNSTGLTAFNNTVSGVNNWWGAATGPSNLGGGGNNFNGNGTVSAAPFLMVVPPCAPFDSDIDNDNTPDNIDGCPFDSAKIQPGVCGCGVVEDTGDADNDGSPDCLDECDADADKSRAGVCGCGVVEDPSDSDRDGVINCLDRCPSDSNKVQPGVCGCGLVEDPGDDDNDGTRNCDDACPDDENKIEVGLCGCGIADGDNDNSGTADCLETLDVSVDAPGEGWLGQNVRIEGTVRDAGCNTAPRVQATDDNRVTFDVSGNSGVFTVRSNTLTDGLYESVQVQISSTCSPSRETIALGTFGVDNADPTLTFSPFDQQGVDPEDLNSWKALAAGTRILMAMRASDTGSGVASLTITLHDADDGSNTTLASSSFTGRGEPLRGRSVEIVNRCDDEGVCSDERLDVASLGNIHYRIQVVVTDHAGRRTERDFYFQVVSLRQAIVAWKDAVEAIEDEDPRRRGEINEAIARLGDTLQGFDESAFGNMSLGLEDASAALRRAFGPSATETKDEANEVLRLLTEFHQLRRDTFRGQNQGRREFDEAQTFIDQARAIAQLPPRHLGEAQEGFLKNANAYFWIEDGHVPMSADNFADTRGLIHRITEEMEDYATDDAEFPGASAILEAAEELAQVQDFIDTIVVSGNPEILSDLQHVQLLLGLTNTAEFLKRAEQDGVWVRNWQWGLTQIVFIYARRGVSNAASFLGRNNPVISAGFAQLDRSDEFREDRRPDDFMELLIASRCLILGVYNLVYDPDEEVPDACCEDIDIYNGLDDRVPVPDHCE